MGVDGGNGGGIILLRAMSIETDLCSGVSISANGETPPDGGNDGAGGGGAGGAIMFYTDNWEVDAAYPILISSNGGDGSSSLSGGSHAGGGGGPQGTVIFNEFEPTTNVTTETLNGDPGCGNTSNPCNSLAGTPTGTDDSGIMLFISNALSTTELEFRAQVVDQRAQLSWMAYSDLPNATYELRRSKDNKTWEYMGRQDELDQLEVSQTMDEYPFENATYYLLQLKNAAGDVVASSVQHVFIPNNSGNLTIYPNPTAGIVTIHAANMKMSEIKIMNSLGQLVNDQIIMREQGESFVMILDYLSPGTYFVVTPQATGKLVLYRQ